MKQSEPDYTKEPFSEKLRRHTMDILVLSICVPLMFIVVKYKHNERVGQDTNIVKQNTQSVTDIKQKNTINFADTLKTKTR